MPGLSELPPPGLADVGIDVPNFASGGSILKPLGADRPEHLVGRDEQTAGGTTIITEWDLTEN